jgi:hypothetical protein
MDTLQMILAVWLSVAVVCTTFVAILGWRYQSNKLAWKTANKQFYDEGGRPLSIKEVFANACQGYCQG